MGMGKSVTGTVDQDCSMWKLFHCETIAKATPKPLCTTFLNCPIVELSNEIENMHERKEIPKSVEEAEELLKSIRKIVAEAAKDAYAIHYVINVTKGRPAQPSYPSIGEMQAAGMLEGVHEVTESIGLVIHPEAYDIRDNVIDYFKQMSGVPVQHVDLVYNPEISKFDCLVEAIVAAAKWTPSKC